MKILITGGAGFIGSNFISYMLQAHPEHKIVSVDSLTYAGDIESLESSWDKIRFYKIDITDKSAINRLFEEELFDAVVNFAAESHVDKSIDQPEVFLTTNIIGTQTLMDACRQFGVKRFHQVSTDEVYGDLPLDRPDLTFDENSAIKPSSPYSASKASGDLLVLAYYRTYGLPVTISRCSNNYGPNQFPEKLIPLTILNALQGKRIPVYGNGLNKRDWIYVEDHCAAIDLILQNGSPGEVYNIGGGNELSNLDVVRSILLELHQTDQLISFVSDRPGHDLRYSINYAKVNLKTGWTPKTEFKYGLQKTVGWYLKNQKWWENILNGKYKQAYPRLINSNEQLSFLT